MHKNLADIQLKPDSGFTLGGIIASYRVYQMLGKRVSTVVMPLLTDDDIQLQEVRLPDWFPPDIFQRGQNVNLPVMISALDSNVFVRVRDDAAAIRLIERDLNITLPPRRRPGAR